MTQLYVKTLGQGQPVVLVHGWAMHSGVWSGFAERLAGQYQVICVDLPGHGQSDVIDEFSLETVVDRLVSVVSGSAYWLGWSLGAELVLDLARRYPDKVDGLVLLAGNPCFIATEAWPGMSAAVFSQFRSAINRDPEAGVLRFLSLVAQGSDSFRADLKALKSVLQQYGVPDHKTLLSGLAVLQTADLRTALAEVRKPIKLILAENDALVPSALGVAMQQLNASLQLEFVKAASHAPFLSCPDVLAISVAGFID